MAQVFRSGTTSARHRVDVLHAHIAAISASSDCSALTSSTTSARQAAAFGRVGTRNPSDVVVVAAKRTAITRASKGAFKDTTPDNLLVAVFEATLNEARVKPAQIQDVVVGNVQQAGAYHLPARMAQLRCGFPVDVPLRAVNRQCASGLQAVADVATDIASGIIDVGMAAGVEHMTSGGSPNDGTMAVPPIDMEQVMQHDKARDCLVPMGVTSENVAFKYGVTRERQDAFASWSHDKALQAQATGAFNSEIVPVRLQVTTKDGGTPHVVVVDKDECPRSGSTPAVLSKLKPVFKPDGSTTAGNSSPLNDGAAAVLLMRRSEAERLGAPVLGVFRGFRAVGVEPACMGIGPSVAIPALLKDVGLTMRDIDVFEINEAFASQAVYCADVLGIPTVPGSRKLNPLGGAIALGHPLGCTGARQTATLLHYLKTLPLSSGKKGKLGVVSMCTAGGFGAAALFEGV